MLNDKIIDNYILDLFDISDDIQDEDKNTWFKLDRSLFTVPIIHNGKKFFIDVESINRVNPVNLSLNLVAINPTSKIDSDEYDYKYSMSVKGLNIHIPCEDILAPKEFSGKNLDVYGDKDTGKILIAKSINNNDCIINLINYITSNKNFTENKIKESNE